MYNFPEKIVCFSPGKEMYLFLGDPNLNYRVYKAVPLDNPEPVKFSSHVQILFL
jgi:hypothetical protein